MSINPSSISLDCTLAIYECCTPSSKSSGLGSSVSTVISSEGNSFPAFSIGITLAEATCTAVVESTTAVVVVATLLALFPESETPIIAAIATIPITPPAIIFLCLSISWTASTLSFTPLKNSFFFFLLIFFSLSKFILVNILPIVQTLPS